MDPRHRRALESLGTGDTPHHGGSLRDHLEGTYAILCEWRARDALRLAGLFHSIYGTQLFEVATVSRGRRSEIAALIGEEAEAIVYLFSVTDRAEYFRGHAPGAEVSLTDHVARRAVRVAPATLADLIEIHVANDVEVFPRLRDSIEPSRLRAALSLYAAHSAWLSRAAAEAVRRLAAEI